MSCTSARDPEDPQPCNDTFDTRTREVSPSYVPYGWCEEIAAEAERIHGEYACTSDEVDLGGEVVSMTVEPEGDIADNLLVVGIEAADVQVEVVSYHVDIAFASDALAASMHSALAIFNKPDGDTTQLFWDLYPREDIQGWLLEGIESSQDIHIFSNDEVGTDEKTWRVRLSSFYGDFELNCQ